jgi:hypothetical protein
MNLRHIHAFERDFDIVVERVDGKLKVSVSNREKILVSRFVDEGEMIEVNLGQ